MDVNNYVLSLAALVAWREERGNGLNGCLGVLFVIKNRAKAGWEFGDIFKIITQKNQFDSMVLKGDPNTVEYPSPDDPVFSKLVQYVDGVFDGSTQDTLTQGALYYCDPGPGVTPGGWFQRNIIDNPAHPRVAQIGTTLYFK
jgi:Cell Wall Hydrolase